MAIGGAMYRICHIRCVVKSSMPGHYFEAVYDVVRRIPRGRVTTYGAIADFLALGSARMAGWALRHCAGAGDVPAHRVVNRTGELTGRHHFPSPTYMKRKLESEGVKVIRDRVQDFKGKFWNPGEELL
jgi:methylated-DNA-protein-cysteine methyltransferase related protein